MSRRRGLSQEDHDLWSRVARSAKPMRAAGSSRPGDGDGAARLMVKKNTVQVATDVSAFALPSFRIGQTASDVTGQARYQNGPTPAEQLASDPVRMDHKTYRRMAQGKLRPQARLDLHGMTLAEAHPELIHFILSARARGLRLVLVITGKGRGDHGPLPTRPGALRHHVPIWTRAAPLNAAVQQIKAAHHCHGGEGAYYVYLRR